MSELEKTEGTKGQSVPPLPALTWNKAGELLFQAFDTDGNKFEMIIPGQAGGDDVFYVFLNEKKYGLHGDFGNTLREAWEKTFQRVFLQYERKKQQILAELKALEAKFHNVSPEKVEVDVRINKEAA